MVVAFQEGQRSYLNWIGLRRRRTVLQTTCAGWKFTLIELIYILMHCLDCSMARRATIYVVATYCD